MHRHTCDNLYTQQSGINIPFVFDHTISINLEKLVASDDNRWQFTQHHTTAWDTREMLRRKKKPNQIKKELPIKIVWKKKEKK